MSIAVVGAEPFMLNLELRMPFRFGIVTLRKLPHLYLRLALEVDGEWHHGVAAESLPPKWFTKDPGKSFADEMGELLDVIATACNFAREAGRGRTPYELWRRTYAAQAAWGKRRRYPPLLWAFGVTLVERAMIEAFCRATGTTFAQAVRANTLGASLGDHYGELAGREPAELLPERPLRQIIVRHTVGLVDPLTDEEIAAGDRLDDGLPQSLEASIRAYGLTHFKLKLWGDAEKDRERLKAIAAVIERNVTGSYAFTLDGNENYHEIGPFRELWESLVSDPSLKSFVDHLLFAEQPLRRDITLSDEVARHLRGWRNRPPMIIDESDGELTSLAAALDVGYDGTSYKSCKGVFKGIANACLIEHRRRTSPRRRLIMSGEDLTTIGPVALLEDLAALATLGIEHAERNGHHYFTGLAMLPPDVQAQVLAVHGDLYRRHERGYPTLDVRDGRIRIGSVVDAPFGIGFPFDPSRFTPIEEWTADSLGAI